MKDGAMAQRSPEDRAWGFTEAEYVRALSFIASPPVARAEAAQIFSQLKRDPQFSVGGDDRLLALLSLVSDSGKSRIQRISGWSNEELKSKQQAALRTGGDKEGQPNE